ncbi:MAG: hypothetical protein KGH58_01700 [Candidatus Micrarchaeota archaeon]|nr:hypothetical protein [Candidatus Micrarchaeota archaeon]
MPQINIQDKRMRQLQHAGASGDIKTIRRLLEDEKVEPDIIDLTSPTHAHTGSQTSATKGRLKALELFFMNGAYPYIYSRTGIPLEGLSGMHGHTRCANYIKEVKLRYDIKELAESYSDE